MDENDVKVRERITALESSLKSLHKRVDHAEELVEGMYKITVEIQHMREDLNSVAGKVNELESQPAKRWDSVIGAVLGALAGGLGAMLLNTLAGG